MKAFVTNSSAYQRPVQTGCSDERYIFFGGKSPRPIFVKNEDDIEWFENNPEFTEVEELSQEEKKQVEDNDVTGGTVEDPPETKPLKSLSVKELKAKAKELHIGIEGKPSKKVLIELIKNYLSTTN